MAITRACLVSVRGVAFAEEDAAPPRATALAPIAARPAAVMVKGFSCDEGGLEQGLDRLGGGPALDAGRQADRPVLAPRGGDQDSALGVGDRSKANSA